MAKKSAKGLKGVKNIKNLAFIKLVNVKNISISVVSLGILLSIFFTARHFFLKGQFFLIRDIVVNARAEGALKHMEERVKSDYLGKNIFSINLTRMKENIEKDFPKLEKVELNKVLPDTIEVDATPRMPLALIKDESVLVDSEGVVLSVGEKATGLTQIRGIRFYFRLPAEGERIKNKSLTSAIMLLKGLNEKTRFRENPVAYVDVSDDNNVVLGVDGVTIKMGSGKFSEKIDKLIEILEDPKVNIKDMDYIDLRFEDAVVSLK